MSEPKVPYITRLELDKQKLTTALRLVLEYHKALDFVNITGYKADAQKKAEEIRGEMTAAVEDALKIAGGHNG